MRHLLTKLWLRKQLKVPMDEEKKKRAMMIMSLPPVRDYLIALMGELVREGIYLSEKQQEGARFTIDLLSKEIQKGDALSKKE